MSDSLHPRERFKLLLWYSQAIVLNAATPGQTAKEAVVRDAQLLRDTVEAWVEYCHWSVEELWREIWKDHPQEYAKVMESRKGRKPGKLTGQR